MKRSARNPFRIGDIVTSWYRVPPFLADETLRVIGLVNIGTKTKPEWRVQCKSDREVEGTLDGDTLTVVGYET